MSNWVDMHLDVLASSPDEINAIEVALQNSCDELIAWRAQRAGVNPEDIAADIKEIVAFEPIRNLGYTNPSINKARRFGNEYKDRFSGLVWSHVYFVSRDFPDAIFLVEYWDTCMSYAGKTVIRANRELRHIHDGDQQAQGYEWVLPDIFAPYKAEYYSGEPFGVFWNPWLLAMESALGTLKERYGTPKAGTTCESALLEWTEKFERAAEFMEGGER